MTGSRILINADVLLGVDDETERTVELGELSSDPRLRYACTRTLASYVRGHSLSTSGLQG